MKEATGELNMTVITVVAIAAVAAIFTAFILPAIRNNLKLTTACNAAGQSHYEDSENGIQCDGGECTIISGSGAGSTKTC